MACMNKKAVFMTLGMIFVSLSILAFANVILNNSETSESRIKEFAETERLYNLDRSLSRSISRIMKYSLSDTHDISFDGSVITFRTEFQNRTEIPEVEIKTQLNITHNRLKKQAYVNFSTNDPLLGKNKNIIIDSLNNTNSTVFYVDQNKSIFIEYASYPANIIFLAGIDQDNVKSINFTYKSDYMKPKEITSTAAVTSGACANCIEFTFNTYYQGALVHKKLYNLTATDNTPSLYKEPFFLPMGYIKFLDLNVTVEPDWLGVNRTLTVNWINLTFLNTVMGAEASEGLAIMLPDIAVYNIPDTANTFDIVYYGDFGDGVTKRLVGDTEIELQIFLEGEALKHEGTLVGPKSYSVGIPLLETKGEGIRMEYLQ